MATRYRSDQGGPAAAPPAPCEQQTSRTLSCLRCKRRKQRCDKLLPTCTPCRKSGLECTGMLREAQERKGIVNNLLDHVAALEAELRAHQGGHQTRQPHRSSVSASSSREVSPPGHQPAGPPFTALAPTIGTNTAAASAAAAAAAAPTTDSSMSMNHLSLSAVAEPRNRAGEFLKHLSTPRLITGVTETFGGNPESTARVDQLWEAISQYIRHPSGSNQRLHIPRDETQKALNTYLAVVDFRYPRLPVDKVRSGMNAISAEGGEAEYNDLINTSPAHIFMAYLVVAIVPLVSDSYPISQGSWVSAHLLSKCLKLLNRVFLQEDGVDIIQCLHLLVILSIHCATAGSAWHLIGFALNKCIALGYHREEPRAVATLSEEDIQQRRWAFWGCYLLDRLICAGLGRPFSIEDDDISVPLPSENSVNHSTDEISAQTGNSITSSSVLKLQTHAYIHLFRYATLLSSAAQYRAASNQDDDDQYASFDDLLGQALYWRTTSPTRGNPSIADIHAHQLSLYNTLLLRVAIRELKDGYAPVAPGLRTNMTTNNSTNAPQQARLRHKTFTTGAENTQTQNIHLPHSAVARIFYFEKDRIRRINLLGICRAVARSLDRSRMTSRPYLSFLTGYSCLSMGLACLFQLTVSQFPEGYDTTMTMFPSLALPTAANSMLPQGPTFCADPSPPSARIPQQRANSSSSNGKNPYWNPEQRMYADPEALVSLACVKLEVAGRQFPRLQEYRMVLEKLRALVCSWSTRFYSNAEIPSMHDQITEFRQTTTDIGPPHLNVLAEAILYLLAL